MSKLVLFLLVGLSVSCSENVNFTEFLDRFEKALEEK